MQFTIDFKRIGFSLAIGRKSATHSQLPLITLIKMWYDTEGNVTFAKVLL